MASRAERLAQDEATFREANERIAEIAERFDVDHLEILCECAVVDCVDRIRLSQLDYERARCDGATFVLVSGHVDPAIERVVFRGDGYVLVEKIDDAAEVVVATDPR